MATPGHAAQSAQPEPPSPRLPLATGELRSVVPAVAALVPALAGAHGAAAQLQLAVLDGFLSSPSEISTGSPTIRMPGEFPTPSPARVVGGGRTLSDYKNAVVDPCALTVSLFWGGRRAAPDSFLDDFHNLLTREAIAARRLPSDHPLARSTLQLESAHDMRRFFCKLPGGMQMVAGRTE